MATSARWGLAIICIALGSWAAPAHAYKIHPSLAIHEAMTALAENCLESYAGAEPYDCSGYYPEHLEYFANLDFSNPVYNLSVASRWSDDPQRMNRGLGYLRFGLVFIGCRSRVENHPGVDDSGLLCNSHFGRLQFLHAMASARGETTEQTAALMLQWTGFTYGLASGEIDHQRNYCRYFEGRGDALAAAMWHPDFRYCGDRTDGPAPDQWTLGTPFLLRCASLVSPCQETVWDAGRREVRVTAMGALLHMVQDSFSQSHGARGPEGSRGYEARIRCLPAERFYNFNGEDGRGQDGHSAADLLPQYDTESCNAAIRTVDDPITASARLLWMLDQGHSSEQAVAYVRAHVLGLPPSSETGP